MSKKIAMTTRPPAVEPAGLTKRLTVDVPEENHTRFKALCAMQRRKMAEEINAFIAQRLAEAEQPGKARS
jgi:hypothetical protein